MTARMLLAGFRTGRLRPAATDAHGDERRISPCGVDLDQQVARHARADMP